MNHLSQGNVVALWQRITHAQHGGWCPNGFGCTYETDGQFGTKTRNHTILWQTAYTSLVPGMAVDGVAGPQSWSAARFFNLHYVSENANFVYYRYGPFGVNSTGFDMQFAKPFATWSASPWYCAYSLIDHPGVSATWGQACW